MNLTRREFIKVSGVLAGSGLFSILGEAIHIHHNCPSCSAISLFSCGCLNCGDGLTKGIRCNNCAGEYSCLQIPFPNRDYLIATEKPFLSMEGIKF